MVSNVNILGKEENARESHIKGNTGIPGKKAARDGRIEGQKATRNTRQGKKDRRIEGSREGRKTAGRRKERETETKGDGEKAREKGTEKENMEMGKTNQAAQQQKLVSIR